MPIKTIKNTIFRNVCYYGQVDAYNCKIMCLPQQMFVSNKVFHLNFSNFVIVQVKLSERRRQVCEHA